MQNATGVLELDRMCLSGIGIRDRHSGSSFGIKGDAMRRNRRTKGFSLIELLIVVAIILIIAAIAIPSFLHSRMAANESAAVAAIRTLNTAQISYNAAYPTVGYAGTLGDLSGTSCSPPSSSSACLIDAVLAGGQRTGYTFTLTNVTGTPNSTYNVIASPVNQNYSGVRYFCSYSDAVVRFSMTNIATCDNTIAPRQ
jgi:type IV pilus assembly protein PilA